MQKSRVFCNYKIFDSTMITKRGPLPSKQANVRKKMILQTCKETNGTQGKIGGAVKQCDATRWEAQFFTWTIIPQLSSNKKKNSYFRNLSVDVRKHLS